MTTENQTKPLILTRIEAADGARCDSAKRLAVIVPEWKEAQAEYNAATDALLTAQSAAGERFPDSAYDEETCRALNRLTAEYDRTLLAYNKLTRRKKSVKDELDKLTENELKLISDSREPGIWDAGSKLGPDGWKHVKLQDLTGSPDMTRDLKKQTWTSEGLEEQGYHTVGEFVQGIGRLIPKLIDNAELAADTVETVSIAVYRFLEKANLLDKWPSKVPAPSGEQMTILQSPEPDASKKPKKGKDDGPDLKLVGGHDDRVELPEMGDFYNASIVGESFKDNLETREINTRLVWADLIHASPFEADKIVTKDLVEIGGSLGKDMRELYGTILGHLASGQALPELDSGTFSTVMDLVCWRATDMGRSEDMMTDEWTAWFARRVCELGGEAVRELTQWHSDLGCMVAAYQDESASGNWGKTLDEIKGSEKKSKGKKDGKKAKTKKKSKKRNAVKKPGKKKSAG